MTKSNELLLCFYGDDFTGSTDALEFLAQAGARTMLFLEPPTPECLARYPGLQAIGVAGMTRSMAPEAIEAELRPALAALRALGAPHVHYKVCSTFDSSPTIGSIGRAVDIGSEIFGGPFVPLLVGAPPLGRHCVFGNLFARLGIGSNGEIYRLNRHPAMSRHPITPADESDLRLHLAKQTKKEIALFDILDLVLPQAEARALLAAKISKEAAVVLFDVLYLEQLVHIGGLIDEYASVEHPLFSVGSSGVEMALGAHWSAQGRLKPVQTWKDPGAAQPLLVLSGSCSPVTEAQIARALAEGFAEVVLDTATLVIGKDFESAVRQVTAAATAHLKSGRSAIVHTSKGNADPRIAAASEAFANRGVDPLRAKTLGASLFGSALGCVARNVVEQTGVKRVVFAGGDTSSYAARELGIEALEMIAPLAPGAPLCLMHAPGWPTDGLEVNFKGGQVGAEDYFLIAARGQA